MVMPFTWFVVYFPFNFHFEIGFPYPITTKMANDFQIYTLCIQQAVAEGVLDPDADTSGTYKDWNDTEYHALSTNEDTIGRFPNYFQWKPENEEFCLDSFHFHWGTSDLYGSEHYVDGVAFPLEVHFVHYSWYDISHIICQSV